jgi:hypothetical protein
MADYLHLDYIKPILIQTMSEFTEQTIASIETLVDDMTTMVLIEPLGNTTETTPITNQPNYFIDFPDSGRVITCRWCRRVECTDPECITMLELEDDSTDRTCLDCGHMFSTEHEREAHEQHCIWRRYPEYSDFCCDCCGSYFEDQEQLDHHNPDRCWSNNNVTHVCSYCGDHFTAVAEYLAHEHECWNEYEMSRMDAYHQNPYDEYQAELEQ